MRKAIDLNAVSMPNEVVALLRAAADQYSNDVANLEASEFMDARPWQIVARELDRAADRINKQFGKRFPHFKV